MSVVATGKITLCDANDAPVAVLSQDRCGLPANASGVVSDFSAAVTTLSVLRGPTDESSLWTVTVVKSDGVTGTLEGKTFTVTGLSTDAGYVDFTASRPGFANLIKRFSLGKIKQGEKGDQGIDAPKCLGLYDYAERSSITGMVSGSLAVLYSATVEERGIYAYVSSTWTRQATPTADQVSRCFLYVLDAVRQGYGVSSHYIGSSTEFETLLVKFLYVLKMRLETEGAIYSGGYDEYGDSDGKTPGVFIGGDGRFKGVGASFDSANILSLSSQDIMTLVDYYGSWVFGAAWGSETAFTIGNAALISGWGLVSTTLPNGQVVVVGKRKGANNHATTFSSTGVETGIAYLSHGKPGDIATFASGRAIFVAQYSNVIRRSIRETSGVWWDSSNISAPGFIDAIGACELFDSSVLVVVESGDVLYEIVINEDGTYSSFTNIGSASVKNYKIELVKDASGNIIMTYSRNSDGYSMIAIRNTSGSWGAHSVFVSVNIDSHSLMRAPDGTIHYYFRVFANPSTLKYKVRSVGGTWGTEVTLFTVSVLGLNPAIAASILGNGKILIAYTIAVVTDPYYRYRIDNSYYSSIPKGALETQVGAGIIEVGQNSNGTYIKFSDGTLIQYQQVTVTVPASSGPSGGYAYQYDFATPFVGNKPCLSIGASEGGPPPGGARFEVYSIGAETYKWGCAISNNWSESLYCEIKMMAIGRWK